MSQKDNQSFNRVADQQNPPTSSSLQPIMSSTPMMVYSQLPTPAPMSGKGNFAENWVFFFFKESWESYKIVTKLDKKPKQVVLEMLKTVLGRDTYQIAKNLPVTDQTDPNSLLDALSQHFEPQRSIIF